MFILEKQCWFYSHYRLRLPAPFTSTITHCRYHRPVKKKQTLVDSKLSYPHNESMKSFTRLPLYLGIGVFVLSVILSGTAISDRNYLSRIRSQAGQNTATIKLVYAKPDLVSVVVNS